MPLLFLRHGETPYNVEQRENSPYSKVGGRSNWLPLNDTGVEQAQRAAEYFTKEGVRFDAWYSSPALRAVTTGAIVLDTLNFDLKPEILDDLQEMGQGDAEGEFRDIIWTPENSQQAQDQGMSFKLPNGESLGDVAERKFAVTQALVKEHKDDIVLVTGHGMAIRCLAAYINGWDRDQILACSTPNCSLTSISEKDGQLVVNYFAKDIIGEKS